MQQRNHGWGLMALNGVICILAVGILGVAFIGILEGVSDPTSGITISENSESASDGSTVSQIEEISVEDIPQEHRSVGFSEDQQILLDKILQALRDKDDAQAAMLLKSWYELWEAGEDWTDFSGQCYDGQSFSTDFTGTALASDGVTRFYYGSLTNGVPDGQGVRIALFRNFTSRTSYFWVEGTWTGGILTGNARVYLGEILVNNENMSFVEMQCVFDSTQDEIMTEATVFQQKVYEQDEEYPMEVYQFSFHVTGGELVASEWDNGGGEYNYYNIESKNVLMSDDNVDWLFISSMDAAQFQNPYPWGQPYRFPYQPIFGCSFIQSF